MKKLYEVAMVVYVMAETEQEAHETATSFDMPLEVKLNCEIYETNSVRSYWMNTIPYGSDDDKTCREVLANQIQSAELSVERTL